MIIALIISILISISVIKAGPTCNFSSPSSSGTYIIGEPINISLSVEAAGSSSYTFTGRLLQPPNTTGPQTLISFYNFLNDSYRVTGHITVPTTFSSEEATLRVDGNNGTETFTCTITVNITNPPYYPRYPQHDPFKVPFTADPDCDIPKCHRRCRFYDEDFSDNKLKKYRY